MPATTNCVFCAIIAGEQEAVIILETERLIAFLDHRPLFRGHTLLVPKSHLRLLSDLPADLVPEFFTTAQRLERAVEDGLGTDGSMILVNNVVSQSVPHLHLHVIPRNKRDGLRFWLGPRHPYDAAHPAQAYADKIKAALANLSGGKVPGVPLMVRDRPSFPAASARLRRESGRTACPPSSQARTASHANCSRRCPPGTTAWPSCCPSARTAAGARQWSAGCSRPTA